MIENAVFPEFFAVVGSDDNQRALKQTLSLELIKERA